MRELGREKIGKKIKLGKRKLGRKKIERERERESITD